MRLIRFLQRLVGYTPTTGLQFKTQFVEGVGVFVVPIPRSYVAED